MSFDFATLQYCTHEVIEERVFLDEVTGSSILLDRPITNSDVKVTIDGYDIPRSGLYGDPTISVMNSGPYRITKNKNDLLYIKIGDQAPKFYELITGSSISPDDLAYDLSKKIPEIIVTSENKRIVFTARDPKPGNNFCFFDPRWEDKTESLPTTSRVLSTYSHLGIIPGRYVSSRKIYPGWDIIEDNDNFQEDIKKIQFHSPIKNSDPTIRLSYFTLSGYCRRCFGSKLEYDYNIIGGTYETVEDSDLLAQEFDKFLFTRKGSHFKWSWLGSELADRIGSKVNVSGNPASRFISLDVTLAFSIYQNIKSQQYQNYPQQDVTDAEFPTSIAKLRITTPFADDPTIVQVDIDVTSRSRVLVPLKRVISPPYPYSLVQGGDPTLVFRARN